MLLAVDHREADVHPVALQDWDCDWGWRKVPVR